MGCRTRSDPKARVGTPRTRSRRVADSPHSIDPRENQIDWILAANSRRKLSGRKLVRQARERWGGESAVPDAPDQFATSITVGSGPTIRVVASENRSPPAVGGL